MNKNKLINKSYIIAALLSNNFFISKILLNNMYKTVNDSFIYYVFITLLLIIISSPFIYRFLNERFLSIYQSVSKISLLIYVVLSSFISILIIGDFVSVHWLSDTPIYIIIFSFMILILYTTLLNSFDVYKTINILAIVFFIILISYYIFKIKYIFIPMKINALPKIIFNTNAIILSIFLYFETYIIFLLPSVNQNTIDKKFYYLYIVLIVILISLKSLVQYNEFRGILKIILYPLFESYNTIYFGQYIGYLNFPVLFYYLIGSTSKIVINVKILQSIYPSKIFSYISILLICIFAIYFLMNFQLISIFKNFVINITLLSLVITLILYKKKVGISNGNK